MKIRLGDLYTGPAGTARQVLIDLEPSDRKVLAASLGVWFIDAPGQSAVWRHYQLSLIHLRPIDGEKPAHIREPGATHELILLALNPELNPDPLDPNTWSGLSPMNLAEQFTLRSDAQALKLLRLCASRVTDGYLWAEPPLSGQREPWRTFIRDAIARMADAN